MTKHAAEEFDPPFELLAPRAVRAPFLFDSPHSGRDYPARFLAQARLNPLNLRQSEDFMIDKLFDTVVGHGMALLKANFPRAYLDVNREPYELDARMFDERLPAFVNSRSVRVANGLGTVARVVADGQGIYKEPLSISDAMTRIEQLYFPYHRLLENSLQMLRKAHDFAVLIDCHSMPSTTKQDSRPRPDIVLGDRYGTSCSRNITDIAQNLFEKLGYSVRRNTPYAGGFITERYGAPTQGLHALQIEINRGLYMDETLIEPLASFDNVRRDLDLFAGAFSRQIMAEFEAWQAAAE